MINLNDIWGNEQAKRAVEIAEKGKFSIKFIGNEEAEMFKNHCIEKGLTTYAFRPCPCGNLGDPAMACQCSAAEAIKHRKQILLCKTDITVETTRIRESDLKLNEKLPDDSLQLLKQAMLRLKLSQTEILSIVKVAKTIMEIAKDTKIKAQYIAEALQYREKRE